MTKESLHAIAKQLSPGDHIRIQYKAMPFGLGPHGPVPNVVGGSFVGIVGDALAYDDISGDGQTLRAYVDPEDIVTVLVLGKVAVARPRLM